MTSYIIQIPITRWVLLAPKVQRLIQGSIYYYMGLGATLPVPSWAMGFPGVRELPQMSKQRIKEATKGSGDFPQAPEATPRVHSLFQVEISFLWEL